jgi:hypothetical protein
MPRKIQESTKDYLVNVPLPQHAASYTVISHKSIMDYAVAELSAQGFSVVEEQYRATHDGQIAQGVYKLNYAKDNELSLMFAWSNSYNKQLRFRCVVGGFINDNGTVMITGDMGNYARKHTGNADQETIDNMKAQVTNAYMYYDMLLNAKEAMKKITISTRKKAELLGILFADVSILTTEQANMVRQQIEKPSFFYSGGSDTLWAFYNHVTHALQQSHPRTWLEDQRLLHWFIESEYDLSNITEEEVVEEVIPVVDPLENNYGQPENQTNLLVQIAEETGDESLLKAQFPLTPEDAFAPAEEIVIPEDKTFVEVLGEKIIEKAQDVPELILPSLTPAPEDYEMYEKEEFRLENPIEETIQYTDPAGNTFEAPIVTPCAAHDLETEEEVDISDLQADYTPEESNIIEEDGFDLVSEDADEEDEDPFSFDF